MSIDPQQLAFDFVFVEPPIVRVVLACSCGYRWIAAHIQEGAWWSAPPSTIASQAHCPNCDHAPPMQIVALDPL